MKFSSIVFRLSLALAFALLITSPLQAESNWVIFERSGFRISINSALHSRIIFDQIETHSSIEAFDLLLDKSKPVGGTIQDVGFSCSSTIEICSQWTRLFSISTDGKPIFQDPTLAIQTIESKWEKGFLAFPLCGYTDLKEGQYQPYGAQCASVLVSDSRKTYFFSIVLGRNTGCREPKKCWPREMRIIKDMLSRLH